MTDGIPDNLMRIIFLTVFRSCSSVLKFNIDESQLCDGIEKTSSVNLCSVDVHIYCLEDAAACSEYMSMKRNFFLHTTSL